MDKILSQRLPKHHSASLFAKELTSAECQSWVTVSTALLSAFAAYNAYSPMEQRVQVHLSGSLSLGIAASATMQYLNLCFETDERTSTELNNHKHTAVFGTN
jgi:hypothetical protein